MYPCGFLSNKSVLILWAINLATSLFYARVQPITPVIHQITRCGIDLDASGAWEFFRGHLSHSQENIVTTGQQRKTAAAQARGGGGDSFIVLATSLTSHQFHQNVRHHQAASVRSGDAVRRHVPRSKKDPGSRNLTDGGSKLAFCRRIQ